MRRSSIGSIAAAAALVASSPLPLAAQGVLTVIATNVQLSQPVPGPSQNLVIDFLHPTGAPNGLVTTCCFPGDQTGVFSALLPAGEPGLNTDLVLGPAAAPSVTSPPAALLTIGGFTFTATGFEPSGTVPGYPFDLIGGGLPPFMTLNVHGTATGPSLPGPTPFVAVYWASFPQFNSAGQMLTALSQGSVLDQAFSAEFRLVPEPGTIALVATGLLALGALVGRRRES